ncbi:MAG TPA: HEAT repeat domain-containing protein [Candidatus Saccharimonadaceae bacterium]|nr:HEAT repeat domain-containing protein [Candidatus Saccharimonadaceae bacterium]
MFALETSAGAASSAGAFAMLVEWTVKSTAVLAAAGLLSLVLRRASAARRHLVWTSALLATLALPALLVALPAWRIEAPRLAWLAPRALFAHPKSARIGEATDTPESATPVGGARDVRSSEPAPAAGTERETSARVGSAAGAAPTPAAGADLASGTGATDGRATRAGEGTTRASNAGAAGALASGSRAARAPLPWARLLLVVWLAGALLVLATFVAGHVLLRLTLRAAHTVRGGPWRDLALDAADRLRLSLPFALLESDAVRVPMACGTLRPRVLLPASAESWSDDRKRAVLLHELAHIERHDCLTHALAQLACAALWFHPGVWWAASRMRVEREQACDDRVLASATSASDYAHHLLEIVRSLGASRLAGLGAVAFARPSSFEGRLVAVLDPRRDRRRVGVRLALPAAALALAAVLPLAALQPTAVAAHGNDKGRGTAAERAEKAEKAEKDEKSAETESPSRVQRAPDPDRPLAERIRWARDAAHESDSGWWVGWQIEGHPELKAGMLSDSDGLDVGIFDRDGLLTLDDVLKGAPRGTWHQSEESRIGPVAVLVHFDSGGDESPTRIRIQSMGLPCQLEGDPIFWLGPAADEQSVAWLRVVASHQEDADLRAEFVKAIGVHRSSDLVVPYLSAQLSGSEADAVRSSAAEALAWHRSPKTLEMLGRLARTDRTTAVRRSAVDAMGRFGTPEALDQLLDLARAGRDEATRWKAFDVLGGEVARTAPEPPTTPAPATLATPAWPPSAMAPMAPAPSTSVPPVPASPASAPRAPEARIVESDALPEDPSEPLAENDLAVQLQAVEALSRYPAAQSLPRLENLAETHRNEEVRCHAVECLARLDDPRVVDALDRLAWHGRQKSVRTRAVESLGRTAHSDQALEKLEAIANRHPGSDERRMAVEAIGRVDSPRALELLERVVQSSRDADAQRQAVESLGRRDDSGTSERLMRIARTHAAMDVRRQAIESLGRVDGTHAAQMHDLAKSDLPIDLQRQAVESLGRLDEPEVPGMLLDIALHHPALDVQRQAVESLGRLDADTMPQLETLARTHPASDVRREAVEAMARRDPDRALPMIEKILAGRSKSSAQ